MKISKSKKVKSSEEIDDKVNVDEPIVEDEDLCDELGIACSKHSEAKELIHQAIDVLASTAAKGDTVARDALADLSVVFFEL